MKLLHQHREGDGIINPQTNGQFRSWCKAEEKGLVREFTGRSHSFITRKGLAFYAKNLHLLEKKDT